MSDTATINVDTGEIIARGEVVPFDASVIESAGDPAHFVELACARAKEWLAEALERGDIDGIVELKSQAEAIRTYTAQKQLGKDTELSAQEIVRRAERGIGLAIRKGQEEGRIAKQGDIGQPPPPGGVQPESPGCKRGDHLERPTDYVPRHELGDAIYPLANADDAAFEAAIDEAKAEQNLSRANVLRKVKGEPRKRKWNDVALAETFADLSGKGYSSTQIAQKLDMSEGYVRRHAIRLGVTITADEVTRNMQGKRPDSNVVVEGLVAASEMSPTVIALVEFDALDPQNLERWISSLSDSIRSLTTLRNNLKKELIRG